VVVESRFFEAAVECAEMRITLARLQPPQPGIADPALG
jgi:hypothetical protein